MWCVSSQHHGILETQTTATELDIKTGQVADECVSWLDSWF